MKLSLRSKGHVVSPEQRADISRALTGRTRLPFTAETKAKMAAAAARRGPRTPEHRARLAAALRGREQSRGAIEKRAAAIRGRKHTPEARAKMSAASRRAHEAGILPVPVSRRYTTLARTLHAHLASTGLTLEVEVRFGRYTVDLYDRSTHTAYEADGRYWHALNEATRPGYHAQRDAYLRERHGLTVVRYSDAEIAQMVRSAA